MFSVYRRTRAATKSSRAGSSTRRRQLRRGRTQSGCQRSRPARWCQTAARISRVSGSSPSPRGVDAGPGGAPDGSSSASTKAPVPSYRAMRHSLPRVRIRVPDGKLAARGSILDVAVREPQQEDRRRRDTDSVLVVDLGTRLRRRGRQGRRLAFAASSTDDRLDVDGQDGPIGQSSDRPERSPTR